jgi:hypothetical protein
MDNLLKLLKLWLSLLLLAAFSLTPHALADELLHLESGAFEIRLKRHEMTSGEKAEVLRIRSATAEQAGVTMINKPARIVITLPSPHPQIDGLLPVSGSKVVKQINFEDKEKGGQITISLHGENLPQYVWDKKLGALMIALSIPSEKTASSSPRASLSNPKESDTPTKVRKGSSARFNSTSTSASGSRTGSTVSTRVRTLKTEPAIEGLVEDYVLGINDLNGRRKAKNKKGIESKQSSAKPKAISVVKESQPIQPVRTAPIPKPAVQFRTTTESMAAAKIGPTAERLAAVQAEPKTEQIAKGKSATEQVATVEKREQKFGSEKKSREMEEMALALLTPEVPTVRSVKKSTPKKVAERTPPSQKSAVITEPRVPTVRDSKHASVAPRTPASHTQSLKRISFLTPSKEKKPALRIALSRKASFSIVKKTSDTYRLIIPKCQLSEEHLSLPYFPPVDFKGLKYLQPRQNGKGATIEMVVERGYKINAVSNGSDILVTAKSML